MVNLKYHISEGLFSRTFTVSHNCLSSKRLCTFCWLLSNILFTLMGTLGSSPRASGMQQLHLSVPICYENQMVRNVIQNQITFAVGKREFFQEISEIKEHSTLVYANVRLDKYCGPSWLQLSRASPHGVPRAGTPPVVIVSPV